jgi:hypothetical protein
MNPRELIYHVHPDNAKYQAQSASLPGKTVLAVDDLWADVPDFDRYEDNYRDWCWDSAIWEIAYDHDLRSVSIGGSTQFYDPTATPRVLLTHRDVYDLVEEEVFYEYEGKWLSKVYEMWTKVLVATCDRVLEDFHLSASVKRLEFENFTPDVLVLSLEHGKKWLDVVEALDETNWYAEDTAQDVLDAEGYKTARNYVRDHLASYFASSTWQGVWGNQSEWYSRYWL